MPLDESKKFHARRNHQVSRHHHQGRHPEDRLGTGADLSNERVLIAGAGPVGLVAAAHLARARRAGDGVRGRDATLSEESRASTFHPPTLDMLHALGAAEPLIAQGLKAPTFQYRTKKHGLLAEFDFAAIADATRPSLPGAVRAIEAHAHPVRADARPSELCDLQFGCDGDGRQRRMAPASR